MVIIVIVITVILQKTENVDFTDMLSEVCRCVLNCSGKIHVLYVWDSVMGNVFIVIT